MIKNCIYTAVTILLFVLQSSLSWGQTNSLPNLEIFESHHSLAGSTWFIVDESGQLTIDDILESEQTSKQALPWQRNTWQQINFGFSDKHYWLKIPLYNSHTYNQDWVLEIAYPLLHRVHVFEVDSDYHVVGYHQAGDKVANSNSALINPNIVFPLTLPIDQERVLYIQVQSDGSTQIPLTLWQWSDFSSHSILHFLIQGIFYGMVLIMALYNLVIWLIQREPVYLSYVSYIVFFTLFQLSLHGIGQTYIWSDIAFITGHITSISLSLLLAAISAFILDFFDMRRYSTTMAAMLTWFMYWFIFLGIMNLFIPYSYAIRIASFFAWMHIMFIIYIAIYMLQRNHPSARYFAMAWAAFLIGALLLALNKFAILPITTISEYGLQFGAGLEIMFLSLALADRMANAQQERINAQQESLALAHQVNTEKEKLFNAEIENLRIEKENNLKLEKLVSERTVELSEALDELSAAHEQLKTISITDALTQLHNRYYFDQIWRSEYKRAHRQQSSIALIVIDIDYFKQVNDEHGHPAGDMCLKTVAHIIKQQANRDSDSVCRLGGEEFAIVLPGTDELGAFDVAEKIRLNIQRRSMHWEGTEIKVTASLGISASIPKSSDEKTRNIHFNQADQALYQAKGSGRNRSIIFSTNLT